MNDPTPTNLNINRDGVVPKHPSETLAYGGEKYEQGYNDGHSRGYLRGICIAATVAIVCIPPATGLLLSSCEVRADDTTTIVVEPVGIDEHGTEWFSDGELFYTNVKGEWLVAPSLDLAGANPIGRGKRVRVHGSGMMVP